ncbi:hypothetical protein BDK51DRAFT_43659 [Blyttiomyces helicus]|uniref:UBA domain-containing protein n=1 Tax=Blyttiomyces helicus TaxID=388810 RepID=A0A4P9VVK1_9FUNG|nr:hypothetical protein BDK51DRAFT_43659 [Blyttiomyces helicus]|eukprot:RKO82855.1 hypothetical protein BDK51DRAFT_43659 [Blyttiomyces helicus]
MVRGAGSRPAASPSVASPAAAATSTSTSTTTSTTTASSTASAAPNPFAANPLLAALGGGGGVSGAASGVNPFAAWGGMGGMGGGGGIPGSGPIAGMDPALVSNLMQNPAFASSVSQLMANPQFMESMIASNPQLNHMMTPQVREMMSSEEFRSMLSNPAVIQSMMQLAPLMGGMGGQQPGGGFGANPYASMFGGGSPAVSPAIGSTPSTSPTSGAPGASPLLNPAMLQMLMGMNGLGMGGAGAGATPATPSQPPEELYQVQLTQLQEMGFYDAAQNLRALTLVRGNVEAAVEWLFAHPPGTM